MTAVAGERGLVQLMAIHTGVHGNIFLLPERNPVFHGTMAHLTFHFGVDVILVFEENITW